MKNSAETSSGFSLFSIDEHRLSVGLLVLFVLSMIGYGAWLALSPLLPQENAVSSVESRKGIAEEHVKERQWNKAVEVYSEILRDDSENGYAAEGVAKAWEAQLRDSWKDYSSVSSTTGSASAADEILNEESKLFQATINSWNRLLDNARYQHNAYDRLASIYCGRSRIRKSQDGLDEAVRLLEEMFDKGLRISPSIEQRSDLTEALRDHPRYPALVRKQEKISNLGSGPRFMRRRPAKLNP